MHKLAKTTARKPVSGEVVIPDKLYFRIGEVSRLCGLPSYVLRFWETEFNQLKPSKSGARLTWRTFSASRSSFTIRALPLRGRASSYGLKPSVSSRLCPSRSLLPIEGS